MKQDRSTTTILDTSAALEREIQKIKKFFKTKRGKVFVNKIHTASIKELCDRYDAPKCIRNAEKNKINLLSILYTLNMADREYYRNGRYKYTIHKKPQINLFNGNRIEKIKQIKLTIKEQKIYNKAHSPRKMGFAALVHAYEEHKLKKFENTLPTKEAVKQDIFSKELEAQINTQLYIRREYIRNFLSRVYYKVNKRESFYRLFMVYENKVIPGKIYEKEGDPYVVGYPFANCNEKTSIETLKNILRQRAKTLRDKECIELKLYTKYGILLASSKT